jgi:hypothetical protein
VRYWDSSALVPLCVDEDATQRMIGLYRADSVVITWWGSEIECASALARLERDGVMATERVSAAMERLRGLRAAWHEIQPSQALRDTAVRLLRVHPLRAADAMQLSSAVIASDREPSALEIVTLDARLASAARREGFAIIGIESPDEA